MIGSALGVFRGTLSRKEPGDRLSDVISILSSETEAAQTLQTIPNYLEASGEFDQGP
jgi:hypothetical protein